MSRNFFLDGFWAICLHTLGVQVGFRDDMATVWHVLPSFEESALETGNGWEVQIPQEQGRTCGIVVV